MPKKAKSAQQQLREEIASLPVVPELRKTLFCLATGYVPEYAVPRIGEAIVDMYGHEMEIDGRPPTGPSDVPRLPTIVEWRRMTKDDYGRLSLILKALTVVMGKLVPDLKSVDFNDVNQTEQTRLSDAELAQRINAVMGALQAPVTLPNAPTLPFPTEEPANPSQGATATLTAPSDEVPEWMH